MIEWYGRDGQPLDMMRAAELSGDRAYKIVRQDHVGAKWVSTVWLGLDHSFSGGPPLIFETMVFGDSWSDEICQRYPTEAAAVAGHDQVMAGLEGDVRPCGNDCTDPSHGVREAERVVAWESLRGAASRLTEGE